MQALTLRTTLQFMHTRTPSAAIEVSLVLLCFYLLAHDVAAACNHVYTQWHETHTMNKQFGNQTIREGKGTTAFIYYSSGRTGTSAYTHTLYV